MATDMKQINHLDSQRTFFYNLARTHLDTCFIFAGLAKRELQAGMRAEAERLLGRAQYTYEAIRQLLDGVENEQRRSEVQVKLDRLDEEFNFLKHHLNLLEELRLHYVPPPSLHTEG